MPPAVEPGRGHPAAEEILDIRHHSLFAPRDCEVSPCFEVIKPRLAAGSDFRAIRWGGADDPT